MFYVEDSCAARVGCQAFGGTCRSDVWVCGRACPGFATSDPFLQTRWIVQVASVDKVSGDSRSVTGDGMPRLFDFPPAGTRGRSFAVPHSRRSTLDLLELAHGTPAISHFRRLNISTLTKVRSSAPQRVSWPVLFFKAYANVVARTPELRRVYVPYPRPRLYEHPVPVGRMAVPRVIDNEEGVFLSHVCEPNALTLAELHNDLRTMMCRPIEEQPRLKAQARLAAMPRMFRKTLWSTLRWDGYWRTRWMGTFFLTTVSKYGSIAITPPVLGNSTISFGPVSEDGLVDVVLAYDHRATDGAVIARALDALNEELETSIATELAGFRGVLFASPGQRKAA